MKIELSDAFVHELSGLLRQLLDVPDVTTLDTRAEVSPLARVIQAHLVRQRAPVGTTALRYDAKVADHLPADDKAAFKALTQVRADPALAGWWSRDKASKNKFGGPNIMWEAPALALRAHFEAEAARMAPAVEAILEGEDQ